MNKRYKFFIAICLIVAAFAAGAQIEDAGNRFRRVSPEEATRLRAQIAEAVPSGALTSTLVEIFRQKNAATMRLGDLQLREDVLRKWIVAIPGDYIARNDLAAHLRDQGRYDEAINLRKESIALATSPTVIATFRARLAIDLAQAGRNDEAKSALVDATNHLETLSRSQAWTLQEQINLNRAQFEANDTRSLLDSRFGRWPAAVDAAIAAERYAQNAFKLVQSLPRNDEAKLALYNVNTDLGLAMLRKIRTLRSAGRVPEAEEALKTYIRFSQEAELPPAALAGLYRQSGNIRFTQQEFVLSEAYVRKADKILEGFGYERLNPNRIGLRNEIIAALIGQKRWKEAEAELRELDRLVGSDAQLANRVRFPNERGHIYLNLGNVALAAENFQLAQANYLKTYPRSHFFVAQASGMLGVALFRTERPEARSQAVQLLKNSVHDYMLPSNDEYLEDLGIRRQVRQLIFSTYLDALVATGDSAVDAIGIGEWARSGVVQQALTDAAIRSSANNPALADIVRQEQDARNESNGLRRYLAGDAGFGAPPTTEIATRLRARIAELDGARQRLQTQIKASFPDYDRLVRPVPPSTADIAKGLGTDEALLMLLPTEEAVYVWVVTADGKPAFHRVVLPQQQLAALVRNTRKTLDFAEMGGRLDPFNAIAASDLYQRLLAPVQGAFQGKKQLVVAAGGALSQLPFGVLLTQPTQKASADAPWLIKQASITQVPSVSAWLAVKQFAKAQSAPEPLMGWADPVFGASSSKIATALVGARNVVLTRASTAVDLEKEAPRSALRYADIPPLPETRDELLAIASTLKADAQRDLRLGDQATKASVLQSSKTGELQKKKVLVFATHGLMAGDLPNLNQPALALAAASTQGDDPLAALLTLEDVLSLKLNADWVVLSACNSAAADGKVDEALSGLARGFFYAGSRSLLVTHWAVESESAKQLTTATFEHYTQNPQAPKAESLRQAMLKVMANPEYSHPAFWAPYALVGDGGR